MKAALLLAVSLLMVECTSIPQELNPKIYYKHDMKIQVNDQAFTGVGVARRAERYNVYITSKADMDLLQISSCERDLTVESAIKKENWFSPRRGYKFVYEPSPIEREAGCVLKFAGLEKKNGRHSWALVQFEHPSFSLPAQLSCNGVVSTPSGTSACETLQGLYQTIDFAAPVYLSSKVMERCKIPESADGKRWRFKQPNRECEYLFMELKPPYRRHKLTTMGYEDVPIRGE